jgi:hypothetical protein
MIAACMRPVQREKKQERNTDRLIYLTQWNQLYQPHVYELERTQF